MEFNSDCELNQGAMFIVCKGEYLVLKSAVLIFAI